MFIQLDIYRKWSISYGVDMAESVAGTNTWNSTGTGSFGIGAHGQNFVVNGRAWNGIIGPVGFWHRVLTNAEKMTLYKNGVGFDYPFHQ